MARGIVSRAVAPILAAAVFFGLAGAVIDVPYQIFPMMPFVLTMVAMALLSRNARAPAASLVRFRKEER